MDINKRNGKLEIMKFYENEAGFFLLEKDEKLPQGAKLYEINFPIDIRVSSSVTFPQFELQISSRGAWGFSNSWKIKYKKKYSFTPDVNNKENYILRLLNDLKKGNYEDTILLYIKDAVSEDKFLEIKADLNKLNSIKENKELLKRIDDCDKLKNEIKDLKMKLKIIEEKLNNNFCYKFKNFIFKRHK